MRIRIAWENGEVFGNLNDTATAKKISEALPHTSEANTWGEEVYFTLPIDAETASDATDVVDPGTICYWVQGNALALPYGRTPASQGDECRLVAPVNIVGALEGDPKALADIDDGATITVTWAEG